MAHYLIAVSPLDGHLMPMLEIGAGLQANGHAVTVLTDTAHADRVGRAGLTFAQLDDDARVAPPAPAPAWTRHLPVEVRRFLLGRAELTSMFIKPLGAQADSLRDLLSAQPVDAILADMAFTGVLPLLLGEAPRPPVLVCGVGPLTLSSIDTPPFGMAWQPQPGLDYRQMTTVAHRVIMRGTQRRLNRALRRAGSVPAPMFLSDWPEHADALLQLSVPGFEYPRSDLPATVQFVGPVLPAGSADFDPPDWWDEVAGAKAVIHVTQGTFDNTDLSQLIGPTLTALADRDDCLVIVTTGGRAGQALPQPIPANARVVDWLPYAVLMPCVDVMITNGGYGGVQYALRDGVPVIVAGETSDKAEVAARVDYSGAGIDLGTATPTEDAIRAAVADVITEPGYRESAQRLGDEIRTATPISDICAALDKHCATWTG
ncbi:glycosyltransferase [Mycolicibacterium mengxianglii]|uniref:glycosyltransferase n=1 Tax=Mycolicibacterium mengxianglii TaxID=2736649 RepID=UPI0018D1E74C|nr:glycosyltransferase [Mycolicibacterium mengxianglii]